MSKDLEVSMVLIITLSIIVNIGLYIKVMNLKENFTGTVQQCWDAGGSTFYASKEYGKMRCDKEREKIIMKLPK